MNNFTIIIKTLERQKSLYILLKSIYRFYPTAKVLVADDGVNPNFEKFENKYKDKNIVFYKIEKDSGLSYGRNFLLDKVKTKYFVLCDDDFVFDKKTKIIEAIKILEEKNLDIIGGYIRNYKIDKNIMDKIIIILQKILKYELPANYIGTFREDGKTLYVDYIIHSFPEYKETDIVLNFFIGKTKIIKEKNRWDNELKLQEHTAFFYQAFKNKLKIGFTNILSVQHRPVQNKSYLNKRNRNYSKIFLEKTNFNKVISTYDDFKRNSILLRSPNKIKVSIVVPVYNAEKTLPRLIDRLTNQTYKNLEIIMVDNNSKDGSYNYIKEYKKIDKRIILLKENSQGPNYARLTGFKSVTGKYVYFCDSDDFPEFDTIENFINCIEKTQAEVVIGNYNEIDENGVITKIKQGVFKHHNANLLDYKDFILIKPALWNKIFKKDIIKEDYFVMTRIGEDMTISLLSMMNCEKIFKIDNIVYNYYPDSAGLSSRVSESNLLGIIETTRFIKEKTIKYNKYQKYKEEIDFIVFSHLIYRILRTSLYSDKKRKKEIYDELYKELYSIKYNNNPYYKSKLHYRIANFVVSKPYLFNTEFINKIISNIFFNEKIYKLFKKMDK